MKPVVPCIISRMRETNTGFESTKRRHTTSHLESMLQSLVACCSMLHLKSVAAAASEIVGFV